MLLLIKKHEINNLHVHQPSELSKNQEKNLNKELHRLKNQSNRKTK